MKHIVLGVLAHVDAGKTTLSENLLYLGGAIRKMGRVDNKDAFLDNHALERERGITIFSKQAELAFPNTKVTLLDTPGHVDFSAEMERTLQVLDYAVLIISAADGVSGHTKTLWKLLNRYNVPVFIFVNKMDRLDSDKMALLESIKMEFGSSVVDFTERNEQFYEEVATCNEELLERYLDGVRAGNEEIAKAVRKRELFPCFFGSALKSFGIEELIDGIDTYTVNKEYGKDFSAIVYKISRDAQGSRLTHLKVTGGELCVKALIGEYGKINQIRIYSGERYETVEKVEAGGICAVTGLTDTGCGMMLGEVGDEILPYLEPVLTYRIILPREIDATQMLPKLRELEEEEPQLRISWNEELKEIHAELMGEVQTEIVKKLIFDRYGVNVEFGTGKIVYKETIADTVEGVGHFEPLRHYAEVHLMLEPLQRGMGLVFDTDCSEDLLAKNWQRLILTHLEERTHRGVLTGSPITDMKITVKSGKAHLKHTEGGDFRQASYRAVRNGLMHATGVLLEPYYDFELTVPEENTGHAMTDVERMSGHMNPPIMQNGQAVITGYAPVSAMQDYMKELTAYTRGHGRLVTRIRGYEECHNPEEVIEQIGYDASSDIRNTADSVFCAHGAGFVVPWNEVRNYMHLPGIFDEVKEDVVPVNINRSRLTDSLDLALGTEEIDKIILDASGANRKSTGNHWKRENNAGVTIVRASKPAPRKDRYILVDGYNVIFAWKELSELAADNIDGARGRLLDILCNYQAIVNVNLIVVFDAYRVKNHKTEILDYYNIHVVYTKTAETADRYIEKFAHDNSAKYDITVVTSDGMEQIIIRGEGCTLVSSREFEEEVSEASKRLMDKANAPR